LTPTSLAAHLTSVWQSGGAANASGLCPDAGAVSIEHTLIATKQALSGNGADADSRAWAAASTSLPEP
jgi:hypothetical protein